jgi:hypothetical protein
VLMIWWIFASRGPQIGVPIDAHSFVWILTSVPTVQHLISSEVLVIPQSFLSCSLHHHSQATRGYQKVNQTIFALLQGWVEMTICGVDRFQQIVSSLSQFSLFVYRFLLSIESSGFSERRNPARMKPDVIYPCFSVRMEPKTCGSFPCRYPSGNSPSAMKKSLPFAMRLLFASALFDSP